MGWYKTGFLPTLKKEVSLPLNRWVIVGFFTYLFQPYSPWKPLFGNHRYYIFQYHSVFYSKTKRYYTETILNVIDHVFIVISLTSRFSCRNYLQIQKDVKKGNIKDRKIQSTPPESAHLSVKEPTVAMGLGSLCSHHYFDRLSPKLQFNTSLSLVR